MQAWQTTKNTPHSTTHTLKFTSVEKKSIGFTKTTGGQQDTDVNSKGKTIGFDMLYFTGTSATSAAVNITVDTKGGFLYCTGTISFKTGKVTGKVTGGTGAFNDLGTLTSTGNSTISNSTFTLQAGGTLNGSGSATIGPSNTFLWSGGTMSGASTTTLLGSTTTTISGAETITARTLNNFGSVTDSGSITMTNAVINNEPGATWAFQGSASVGKLP